MINQFADALAECPLLAILRGITPDQVSEVVEILWQNGIRILEIPLNSPQAITSIAIAVRQAQGRFLVGAGTVLTTQEVQAVRQAGASFVVSPNCQPEVIQLTKASKMISIPGFFTVTEAFTALNAGADYLKLFPAVLGPTYIKDLQAVIKAPILAVGGVKADNIVNFLKVCPGVGIGSALYQPQKSLSDLTKDTATLCQIAKSKQL